MAMANYSGIKATINANIKQNNNQEITGVILNSVLNDMVTSLAAGYLFKGVATPATAPGTPDEKVFYLAGEGTYANFGGKVVNKGELGVLKYDTAWHLEVITGLGGGDLEMGVVAEDGLFFVDGDLNIGAKLEQEGFYSINTITYREI